MMDWVNPKYVATRKMNMLCLLWARISRLLWIHCMCISVLTKFSCGLFWRILNEISIVSSTITQHKPKHTTEVITKTRIKGIAVTQTHNFSIFPCYCTITHRVMKLIKSEIKETSAPFRQKSTQHCANTLQNMHINLLEYKYRRFQLLIYVYVFLLLFMFSYFYVYVFLLLCRFCSVYSVSLFCSVYCLCVNVNCTTATGCQPNCS
jgi:hypothetical protein